MAQYHLTDQFLLPPPHRTTPKKKNAVTKQIPGIDSFDTKEQVLAHCITWKNRVVFVPCQYSRIASSFTVVVSIYYQSRDKNL